LLKDVGRRHVTVGSGCRVLGRRCSSHISRLTHECHGDRRTIQQREPHRPAAVTAAAGLTWSTAGQTGPPAKTTERAGKMGVMMAVSV